MARVKGFRRIFAHSPSIFIQRQIANCETLEMASLSAEPMDGAEFVCTAFEVVDEGLDAFREREEEFELKFVEYSNLDGSPAGAGLLCVCSTDDAYVKQWGQERFDELYTRKGLKTIWHWQLSSGLRPCAAYLRHCVLASQRLGSICAA
eukprot:CAMPEP_0119321160 /NCGR_PEP_ID=MMETSP1333-20130426/54614_1 /TAXON_ID=418940 /ORGANISM="Scyphosphaera apsteinii, Strain RCC1455" /LENGTH=148 /DNA_ID=CAMNT_0007328073 /DNA_START=165 /DNA_END=607 /DNA_ORIENTATION=+